MAKILLVDDDESFRKMLHLTLESLGHSVITAEDGSVAKRLSFQHQFDLVITDIIMPDVEGIELIMTMRKQHPNLKIIAMSGGGRISSLDYLAVAEKCGAGAVLAKPFSDEELQYALRSVLGGAS